MGGTVGSARHGLLFALGLTLAVKDPDHIDFGHALNGLFGSSNCWKTESSRKAKLAKHVTKKR